MARQSIPRTDLYGELGVDPSADTDAIEAAYRDLIDRASGSDAPAGVRRVARLRVAREWLTDPELRRRYDAARARAAARAEKAAAEEASTLAATAAAGAAVGLEGAHGPPDADDGPPDGADLPPDGTESAPDGSDLSPEATDLSPVATDLSPDATDMSPDAEAPNIPWPARDLHRDSPEIEWSSTPPEASDGRAPSRRSGLPVGALGLVALAGLVMVGTYALATNVFFPGGVDATPTPQVAGASQPAPTTAATELPSATPTVAPSEPPPSSGPSPVSADVAAMQQAAWQAIEDVRAAAAAGDVAAAQAHLGESAPGLRRSGLRRATFPLVEASSIAIADRGPFYVATAGDDRLTSPDGVAWTFDYGDRPLAAFRSPNGEPVHDLWWVEADGEHHLYVRVTIATVSRNSVSVRIRWTLDPTRPDAADYFRRSTVVISAVAYDGGLPEVTDTPTGIDGLTSLTATARVSGVAPVPNRLQVGITFTNPRPSTSDDRAIETIFALDVR